MNQRRIARALARLSLNDAELRLDGGGPNYGVFTERDRRRRALLRLDPGEVRWLASEGLIVASGEGACVLSAAGKSKDRARCGRAWRGVPCPARRDRTA